MIYYDVSNQSLSFFPSISLSLSLSLSAGVCVRVDVSVFKRVKCGVVLYRDENKNIILPSASWSRQSCATNHPLI